MFARLRPCMHVTHLSDTAAGEYARKSRRARTRARARSQSAADRELGPAAAAACTALSWLARWGLAALAPGSAAWPGDRFATEEEALEAAA